MAAGGDDHKMIVVVHLVEGGTAEQVGYTAQVRHAVQQHRGGGQRKNLGHHAAVKPMGCADPVAEQGQTGSQEHGAAAAGGNA